MTPQQYCLDKTKQSHSSFYYSFYFLSQKKREAMIALYAFCREMDDIVDSGNPEIAYPKLQWWQAEITHLYAHQPQHPITQALLPAIQAFDLPENLLREIILGMQMDLEHVRYPNFATLEAYCYKVAGVVGELTIHILGYRHQETIAFAHTLGLAFQLTNIIRDIGEDAGRNRIYLPQDEMQQFGVKESDILQHKTTTEFATLMDFQLQRAKTIYGDAFSLLPKEEYRAQRVSLIMANIYHTLLKTIAKEGGAQVLTTRISLTGLYKCFLAFQALWKKNWK